MFFLTDSELFFPYENPKSKKVYGTFGLGWKYQGRIMQSIFLSDRFWEKTKFQFIPVGLAKQAFTCESIWVHLAKENALVPWYNFLNEEFQTKVENLFVESKKSQSTFSKAEKMTIIMALLMKINTVP